MGVLMEEIDVIPKQLKTLLLTQLPDDVQLLDHAKQIDGHRYQVASRMVEERLKLTKLEQQHRMIKSKTYTEYDRKMYTAGMTAEQRAIVELLEVTLTTIDKRITLIQSMLKMLTEEFKRSGDGRLS
jgi:hypothetical protein